MKDLQMSPKVFLSHASEDKERFVLGFATRLREKGIDVWLDKWEMLPGDSLVDKIFEEGLKNANAVIVVISRNSVNKPWVREELNAALVRRINEKTKLIPVVIDDDCVVPEALTSTVWEKISSISNYDDALSKIVLAIYGRADKPPLGIPPKYVTEKLIPIAGLTELDSSIFAQCCQMALKENNPHIEWDRLVAIAKDSELAIPDMAESIEILGNKGYLDITPTLSQRIHRIKLTPFGLDQFLDATYPDYPKLVKAIAHKILNEEKTDGPSLCAEFKESTFLIRHVVKTLEQQGMIRVSWYLGGNTSFQIFGISAELKRWLRNDESDILH